MIGDEEYGTVERRGFGVHIEAVIAADEVNSQAAECDSGCGENVWDPSVGREARGVVLDGCKQGVGKPFDVGLLVVRCR
jgi:hypothetical protein